MCDPVPIEQKLMLRKIVLENYLQNSAGAPQNGQEASQHILDW